MVNRRIVSALVITLSLIASYFSALTFISGRSMGAAVPEPVVFVDGNGLVYRAHVMTYDEMLEMRGAVGVREPGRNYNVIIDGHGTGLAPPTENQWNQMVGTYWIVESVTPKSTLAASVDLSTNPTFPKVGNQLWQGSCAAWAATYYTFGYMEAADNGWNDARVGVAGHLMSAAWTYNKVNGGSDSGSWMSDNMAVIRDWGGVSLATMPYNPSDPVSWGTMEAFREAPLHRGGRVRGMAYMGQSTVDAVKALVSAGSPITFAFDAGQYDVAFADGNYIMTSKEYSSPWLNHAQTIVGYDDSIQDDGEKGAFRVVNSWGNGWGDGGFYWLTYDGFMELGSLGVLSLTYMEDLPDYVPSMLAVWHFNAAPTRSTDPKVGIGPYAAPVDWRVPYFEHDNSNRFPTFMALDITDFKDTYDSGVEDFYLSMGSASSNGAISDFKIEIYEGGYTPGKPTQVSGQSPDVPRQTPAIVTNYLSYYSVIAGGQALDFSSIFVTSSTYVAWTSVDHHSYRGGSSMQSGDIGDGGYSDMQLTMTGPLELWFYWKVSSETGSDSLSFSIDGMKYAALSGDMNWQPAHYSLTSGPHNLKWEYSKSSTTSSRDDCGWVDSIIVDGIPPETTAVVNGALGGDGWYLSQVTVTLAATDENGSGVARSMFRVDGGLWQTYGLPIIISGSGQHYVDYYSVDAVGNMEAEKRTDVKIDMTGPTTTASLSGTLGTGGWYVTPVSLSFGATDLDSGVDWTRFRIDGGAWEYNGSVLLDTDGVYLVEFESQDIAGNLGSSDATEVKIDRGLPLTTISVTGTLGNNGWYTSDIGISISASDATSGVGWTAYRVDNGIWQLYGGFFMVMEDGPHLIEYYSEDVSGNRDETLNITFGIDHAAPILQINQGDGTIFKTTTVTITWSAFDAVSGLDEIEIFLDGAPFDVLGPGVTSVSPQDLSEGSHAITVKAVDSAGLYTEKSIDFVVDSLPPTTSFAMTGTSGEDGWFVSATEVTLSATDATTGVKNIQYRINGGLWQPYLAGIGVSGDRIHSVEFYSTDNAGNAESAQLITVKIDTKGPSSSISRDSVQGLDGWYVTEATLTISASDATSGVGWTKYRVDGHIWLEYIEPFNITTDGSHTIEYFSQDAAGNAETPLSTSFKMDCKGPTVEIDSPLGDVDDTSVSLVWRGRDQTSGIQRYEISVDGGAFEDVGMLTESVLVLVKGNHTIVVRAFDNAGNVGEKQLDFEVRGLDSGIIGSSQDVTLWFVYALVGCLAASILLLVFAISKRSRSQEEKDKISETSGNARMARGHPPPPPPSRVPPSHRELPPPPPME